MSTSPASSTGVRAWAALLRCQADLVPRLSRHVQHQAGIPLSWYDVLLELAVTPESRLRIQALGERVVLSRSRVSRIVDDLVDAGLVERDHDPRDGRASLAALTDTGRAAFQHARPIYLAAIDELFSQHLTASEQDTIAAALERVLTKVAAHGQPD